MKNLEQRMKMLKKIHPNKNLRTVTIPFEYNTKLRGKSTGQKVYKDTTILTPGTWTDSWSGMPIDYPSDVLKKYANNVSDQYLNIDHSHAVLDRIGHYKNNLWKDGGVHADLYIYPHTQNARDTIEQIDNNMVNALSVEILTSDQWDKDKKQYNVYELEFVGLAVVLHPACEDAQIKD